MVIDTLEQVNTGPSAIVKEMASLIGATIDDLNTYFRMVPF
jgi:hypothetical protein